MRMTGACTALYPPQCDSLRVGFFLLVLLGLAMPRGVVLGVGPDTPIMDFELLERAQPDECFAGVGVDYPDFNPDGTCPEDSVPKTNEAYIWGLTKSGSKLWFGTAANVNCIVNGGALGATNPELTRSWVCEYGQSQPAREGQVRASIGDWREPSLYRYDIDTGELVKKSDDMNFIASWFLGQTRGIRSACSVDGVVMLMGKHLRWQGTNVFFFDSNTEQFLGFRYLPRYSDIRKCVVHDGVAYLSFASALTGKIARWNGSRANLKAFEEVGDLPAWGGNITAFTDAEGAERLAVTTGNGIEHFSVYLSPVIPPGGLTSAHRNQWRNVWSILSYDPDTVTARTVNGGDIAFHGNCLYWMTMQVPGMGQQTFERAYPNSNEDGWFETSRPTALFRSCGLEGAPGPDPDDFQWDIVIGDNELYAYNPGLDEFERKPNPAGKTRVCGPAGFPVGSESWCDVNGGNFCNAYGWVAGVTTHPDFDDGVLWLGTFDMLYLGAAPDWDQNSFPAGRQPPFDEYYEYLGATAESAGVGADLFRITNDESGNPTCPQLEHGSGLGNFLNYGLRTMAIDAEVAYIGTANPMNLEVCTSDGLGGCIEPEGDPLHKGGWELLKLSPKAQPARR